MADRTPQVLVQMPGTSFQGPLPKLSEEQIRLRDSFRRHVEKLAGEIGERNVARRPQQLQQAADYIEQQFQDAGLAVERQTFPVHGQPCHNLIAEIRGARLPDEVLVVGAHYDTVGDCAGANDNGSGVAALLTLAKQWAEAKPGRTLRLVAFANEESPYFGTQHMGSWRYATACRERGDKLIGMLSLETIGYYSDAPGSQHYPPPFNQYYPSTGNFVGFVGNPASADLVQRAVVSFRKHAQFPSEGGALPEQVDGVGWSDHWAFWKEGYPALMVTDTAPFRYPHYHRPTDTPDKLDYDNVARVLAGLEQVVLDLAR